MDNLAVHFNAEISLKTIKNSSEGVQWIENTFLYQRLLKDPKKYGLDPSKDLETQLKTKCDNIFKQLLKYEFIEKDGNEMISKPLGNALSKYYVSINAITISID